MYLSACVHLTASVFNLIYTLKVLEHCNTLITVSLTFLQYTLIFRHET